MGDEHRDREATFSPTKAESRGLTLMGGDLARMTTLALVGHLAQVVRPVALRRKAGDPIKTWKFGSAQVIRIAGHNILVTAAHNFGEMGAETREMDFGLTDDPNNHFTEAGTYWLDDASRTWAWTSSAVLRNENTGDTRGADADIAAVEITDEEVQRFGFEVVEPSALFAMPLGERVYAVVFGYPTRLYNLDRLEQGEVYARYMCFATQGVPTKEWKDDWSQVVHQVVRYPSEDVDQWDGSKAVPSDLPEPDGISGCTIWTARVEADKLFSFKNLAFCGIQHTYSPSRGVLLGNNAQTVASMLAIIWPDTAAVLRELGFEVMDDGFQRVVLGHSDDP